MIPATAIRGVVLLYACVGAAAAIAGRDIYRSDARSITVELDANATGVANRHAWFGESRTFLGANTDNWAELGIEPRITGETPLGGGTLFGSASAVYAATLGNDASGLTIGNGSDDHLDIEQGHVGWKIADVFPGLDEDTLSISAGRQDYLLGSGLLIADGASDGGDLGGWYTGMREAFAHTAIVSVRSRRLVLEAFSLRNRPRRGGTEGEARGGNLEYTFVDRVTLGLSYIRVDAKLPGMDALDVYDGRFDMKPDDTSGGIVLSGEFAHERSAQIDADGWFAQIGYRFGAVRWAPTLSYRRAHFDGDRPGTTRDERFREIAYGASDYGAWYQGEITGGYPLGNGNLDSRLWRLALEPADSVTVNLIYYDFTLDEPSGLAPGVDSNRWGSELDLAVDWQLTESVGVTGVLARLSPGKAAEQWVGGGRAWLYSLLYLSYSY